MTLKTKEIFPRKSGALLVISGPSGVGKNTLVKEAMESVDGITYSISATTRSPRAGERDGVDYFFLSEKDFKEKIEADEFIEWAEVYGNLYGTPRTYVEDMLKKGVDVILDVDIQGAASIRRSCPEGVFIFVAPPSADELISRLRRRGTEDEDTIIKRIGNIPTELSSIPQYDYILVNADVREASEHLKSIILTERSRVKRVDLSRLFMSFEEKFRNGGGLSESFQQSKRMERAL